MHTRNRGRLWIGAMLAGLLAVYVTLDSRLATGEDTYDKVGKGLEAFGKAYELLTTAYYKPLEPEDLATAAIEGMLEDLDPYTQFFDRRALDQLRIDTQGKFGGLGITISLRGGDVPVVMSVIEGAPATEKTEVKILFNEDAHYGFDRPHNNFRAAVSRGASWGFLDIGENNYRDGYQSPPVNWGLCTERKRAFFRLVREITGGQS